MLIKKFTTYEEILLSKKKIDELCKHGSYIQAMDMANTIIKNNALCKDNFIKSKTYEIRASIFDIMGEEDCFNYFISDIKSAIFYNPIDTELYFKRGAAYQTFKYFDLAIIDYKKVVDILDTDKNQTHPSALGFYKKCAYQDIIECYLEMGSYDKIFYIVDLIHDIDCVVKDNIYLCKKKLSLESFLNEINCLIYGENSIFDEVLSKAKQKTILDRMSGIWL